MPPAGPPCGKQTPPVTPLASAGKRPGAQKSMMSAIGAVLHPAKTRSTLASVNWTDRWLSATSNCRDRKEMTIAAK
jgi:hypothetical protein